MEWVKWLNENWLAVAGPVLILVAFWIGGLWFRKILYNLLNSWRRKTKWKGKYSVIEATWTPFLQWFILLGCAIAIQVSSLPSNWKTIASQVIISLFILSLIWLGEKILKVYLPELRLLLNKIKAPQAVTTLLINIVRVAIVAVGLLILLNMWKAPDISGLLILAAGLAIIILTLIDTKIPYAVRIIFKLLLILLVIAGLIEVVRRGYLLFSQQADPASGTIIFLLEVGFLIWIVSVLRNQKYRYIKPSFKLVFFSLLGIALVCAFAGIEPLSSVKDIAIVWVGEKWETVTSAIPTPTPALEDVTSAVAKVGPAIVRVETEDSVASGMIIDESGYILTNNHVVEDVQSVIVILMDSGQFPGTVIERDELRDLAIIKTAASGFRFPVVTMGDSDKLEIGEEVIAIGYSLGLEGQASVSKGIISAFRTGDGVRYIQTDTSINPGNSGGPLINLRGEVIGIATAKVVHEAVEGMGFAIAINDAKSFITKIRQEQQVEREEQDLFELEKETFDLINAERQERGIPPIIWNPALHEGARKHSESMQEKGFLYHETYGAYAECCYGASYGSSYTSARATVDAWLASTAGHREILLDSQYTQGAIGIARDKGFWVTYRCY